VHAEPGDAAVSLQEIIARERLDANMAGMACERAMWFRFGPFAVSINWYPFRFYRYWRARLRGEYMGEDHSRWQLGPRSC
jgi:hypothetical protein